MDNRSQLDWSGRENGAERRSGRGAGSTARWVVSLPLLLAGSLMFWTMALGSGAVSLMAVTSVAGACSMSHGRLSDDQTADDSEADGEMAATAAEPMPGYLPPAREHSILVHLQESAEPEDVNDNPGAVVPDQAQPSDQSDDDGTGQLPARAR